MGKDVGGTFKKSEQIISSELADGEFSQTDAIKDPRPKGRGIWRGDGEQLSRGGEPDVRLAHASDVRRKRRGMRPEVIQDRSSACRFRSASGRWSSARACVAESTTRGSS